MKIKRINLGILTMAIGLIFMLNSCSINESSHNEESISIEDKSLDSYIEKTDYNAESFKIIGEKFKELRTSTEARQALKRKNCVQNVVVPDDYATIQEAVDAVCDNGKVTVKTGTYVETVFLNKPGLFIKAVGDVTVIGGLDGSLLIAADDVKIHNFKVDNTNAINTIGIGTIGYNGAEVKHNTIIGSGHIGISFFNSSNNSIVQNDVSGPMDVGIMLNSFTFGGTPSNNNKIANNTVSGMSDRVQEGQGIWLYGNCDNNKIQGNTVSAFYGIYLLSWDSEGVLYNTDDNVLKNNTLKNNQIDGVFVALAADHAPPHIGPANNTIGPNNELNDNGRFGMFLSGASNQTHVFNNTALNNSTLDILNFSPTNTFKKNTANNTVGVD